MSSVCLKSDVRKIRRCALFISSTPTGTSCGWLFANHGCSLFHGFLFHLRSIVSLKVMYTFFLVCGLLQKITHFTHCSFLVDGAG